ncbi:double zinc ribbon domain-containing protein [Deinococcus yavapaiensis]|uniref:double zinc ribbon domain-containing protein n=1 Tax=Deinococcus yavapaiensis TaxID=309889 RepID=UPI003CCC6DA4
MAEGRLNHLVKRVGEDAAVRTPLHYRLCSRCGRAVPLSSTEHYCINDGTWLMEVCPLCRAPIFSPYTRYCAACGEPLLQSHEGAP